MRKREGIEPRYGREMWVPTSLARWKAISLEPLWLWLQRTHRGRRPGHVTTAESGTREILWVLPRMGVGWHNRHTGRKPDGPEEVGCPHSSEEVGNAHGAKGDTCRRPFDGNVNHTQRWRDGDHRSRADSPAGSPGTAYAIHVADAPLHGGQPASMLRVARWKESDRSRWGDESDVRVAPRGQPPGAAPETASDGVPASAGTPGGDS